MLALSHLNDDGTTVATPATDANAATATTTSTPAATASDGSTTPPTVGPKNADGTCPANFPWTDALRAYDCVQCPSGYGYDAAHGVCVYGAANAPKAPAVVVKPFYKNWKFWAAIGGVAVIGTGTVMFIRHRKR